MSTVGLKVFCGVAAAVALAACGGGGGGGSSSHVDGVASSGSANAMSIYSGKTSAGPMASETEASAAGGGAATITDVSDTGVNAMLRGTGKVSRTPVDALRWILTTMQAQGIGTGVASGNSIATRSFSTNCGTGTISGDAEVSSPIAAGNYAVVTFSNCTTYTGYTINGQVAYDVIGASGAYPYGAYDNVQIVFAANDLRIDFNDGNGSFVTLNGSYSILASDPYGTGNMDATVQGSTLSVESKLSNDGGSTFPHRHYLLQNFKQHVVTTGSRVVSDFSGTLSIFAMGNSYQVTTVQAIERQYAGAYPNKGQIVVTGQGGKKVRVTALDATQVQFEYDLTGTGYGTPVSMNWASVKFPLLP